MNTKMVNLTLDEIWPILNVLNEVCYGICICDFEKSIHARKENAVQLMEKISMKEGEGVSVLILNSLELDVLRESFKEVFK